MSQPRVLVSDVTEILDTSLASGAIERFIGMAHRLTNDVAAAGLSDAERLAEIELLLACHYVELRDPTETSYRTADGASGTFDTGARGKGLAATVWGQQALALDTTGLLAASEQHRRRPVFKVFR